MSFRARALAFFVFVVLFLPTAVYALSSDVVISQVYGGAGCGTAGCSTYKNDYIELFNRGTSPVSLNGWSVQYAAATGTSWQVTNLTNVSLQPGQYYLVGEGAGANGVNTIPTADATGTIAMSATAAKVALVNSTTALSGACPASASIIDLIGFGGTANCFETAVAPAPSTTTADVRGSGGCTETDNNSTNFTATTPNPRNTATALAPCAPPNTPPTITPPANPITTVAQNAAPFTVNLSGTDDNNLFIWSATPGTGITTVNVTGGQGTSTVTYTVTLTNGFSGTATFTATLSDGVTTPANQAVNITVVAPPAAPTGLAATAGTSHVVLNWNSVSGATTYNVKRSTTSGAETTIASPGTNSYDDTSAIDGTTYFYVVSGVGAGGEGSNSSEVTATPMAAPTGLVATPGNAHIVLNWNAVTGATGYNVKRSTSSGTETTLASPATNTYDDLTAANGTPYFYVVTATNANGESIASSEVTATPNTPGVVVISQAYGGAGCGTAGCSTYKNDYIELFNRGGSPISLNGWSVQYAAATGTAWQVTNLTNVMLQPGQYYLVGEGAGANGVNNIPTADASGTIAMSATAAKIALVNSTVALSGACPASASILDLVGYGATANCSETAPAPAPSTTNAILRAASGCTDAGNNSTDFSAAAAAPRNTATALHVCGAANNPPTITPPANPITTVAQDAAPFTVGLTGSDDAAIYNWSATPGTGVSTVVVSAGQGTANVTYTVTLTPGYFGTATFTATLTDNVNTPVNQAVNITVTPASPAAPTGLNATAGDSHVQLNWNAVSGATSYNVKRSTSSGTETTIASPGTNSFDDITAVNGTTYFYVVSAVGPGGEGANSSEVSATPAATPTVPPAPTSLAATAGSNTVGLTWNAAATATSYNVKRAAVTGGPYTTIQTGVLVTNYTDNTAVNGTTYFYVVSASNAQGEGPNSNEATATPAAALSAPTGLTAAVGDARVVLNWSSVAGATSYNVKRSTTAGSGYSTIGSPVTPTFTDNTAVNATTYYYVVTAFNGSESANSSEVSATPNIPSALGIALSQAYGGGGNAGATLKNDFMELFNRSTQTIDLNGWSVQYVSATGTGTWAVTSLTGTIAPGHYYLIQESAGAGGTVNLPTPDATGVIAMAATGFKVALLSTTTALTGGCPSSASIADLIGASNTATCFETAFAPAPSNTTADIRAGGGCTDTNNNGADFTAAAPTPRNSTTSFICGSTPISGTGASSPSNVDPGNASLLTVTVTPGGTPSSTGINVVADLTAIGGSPTQQFYDDGSNGDVTGGNNVWSYQATVAPATPSGVKSMPATITDAELRSANASIPLTVNPTLETIAAVRPVDANGVTTRNGQLVRVRGVVTSIDFRGGNGVEYYIQDVTGGIDIFHSTSNFGPFTVGASVEVIGTITQFNGLTEIVPSSMTTTSALPPVTPQTVTLSAVNESLEGKLIRVDNVTMTPATFAGDTNYVISDGSGGTLRIDADTNLVGQASPSGVFSLVGVVGQFDNVTPFDSGYQIIPRSTADIIVNTPPSGTGAANPPSVAPGGTSLLTITVTMGQNPPSTGITVTANLSSIGLSGTQTFFDNGTNGDVAPGDNIYSYSATVDGATPLGPKTLPVTITDLEARNGSTSISLNIQSASAPPTPVNVNATPGNGQVALTWDASLGASGYNVKRALVTGGPYSTIAPNIGTNNYTDLAVSNGVRYYYVVSALSGANESGDSNEVNAKPTAPPPSGSLARVYFVDIGQGAGTLIVGPPPTNKTLLIDGGPNTQGTQKIIPLLTTLGISTIDNTLLTHYHIDHDGGLIELINAGKVVGTAYDNGDDPKVQPPVLSNSTGQYYTNYINALAAHSGTITRVTAVGGTVIDLGGGMKATVLHAGGNLLSGGNIYISNTDLNSESISTLVEYGNFDFLISGDMTGGGQTTTAKTPDVETSVAQMARDVDFVQLDHHGSTTANSRRFLAMLKAEGSLASVGASNTFGHPNRETANKYLNIPVTSGNTYGGEGVPPNPGNGPVFYQTDPSPATDNRCTVQGYSGADQAHAGLGTILLKTDGNVSFSMESFDDAGVRIPAATHIYALDSTNPGVTTNFPPTVIPYISPGVPLSTDVVTVTALVNDREDAITSVTLNYSINGAAQAPVTMTPTGSEYSATIPAEPNGTRVEYTVTATAGSDATTWSNGYFAGTTPISTLRSMTALGEPTYLEYAARISGLATSTTGDFSSTNNDDYVDDGTGALNVSRTIEPTSPATQTITRGNTYSVAGLINQLTGRLRLDVTPPFDGITKPYDTVSGSYNPYQITVTGAGTVTPLVRTIAQINADPEGNEAKLVQIANCTVTSGTIPGSGGTDGFLTVNDGTGSIEMKIDGDGDIPGLATPAGTFTLKGIVSQDDFLRPFDTRYTIAPRDRTDLGAAAGGPALITIAQAREDIDGTTGVTPDDYVPDRLGQQVKIRGVVTSVDFRGASGTEVYIQDPTAGVDIFSTSINTVFNIGDNLEVTGTVAQFNGLTEITPSSAADITVLAPGTLPAVNMEVVTLSQLINGGAGEAYEGKLIRVNNITLASPPATFAANTNYIMNDATSTGVVQMRIDSDTDIDGTAPPAGTFSVIGVLGQFDSAGPFDSGYQLFPRIRATDFLPATATPATITATGGTPQTTNVSTAFVQQLQATVQDGSSAPIEGIGVTFTAPASGASGTFVNGTNATSVATNASGVATATVFTANTTAGTYNVVASTASLNANFSLTNVDPSATHFDVSAPASVTAGVAFSVTVTARDASNATATGYNGTFQFASSPPDVSSMHSATNGVATFNVTLTTVGTTTLTATDAINASITGNTNTTVNAPAATHYSVTAPANVTNGVPFNVTVTALDASNATVTGYTGTVHFASSSAGTLPSDYTFVGGDNGSHTFSVTLTTNGAQTITATDTGNASINGTANTTVNAAPQVATHYSVTAPANVTNGVPFNVTVTALDASNATVTGYTGTVHFTSSSAGTLPSDYTFVGGDNGSHTFSVTLTTNGAQSITATDTGNASINGTANTTVNAAPQVATHYSVSAPANVTNGVAFNVTVTALDASNATVTGYTGTVHFTSSSAGTLPSDYTFVGGDNGAHTFSVTLTSNGTQSITATDTVTPSITGTTNTNVTTTPPAATHFSVTAPANVMNGTPFNVTVTALDAGNATVTGYTGTVHFTSSSAGTLPADYTFVAGDNGTHVFSVTLTTNGTQTITATDTVTPSITGTASTNVSTICPPILAPTIAAPAFVCASSPGNHASTPTSASSYVWTVTNGTITAGQGTSAITFTAGASGTIHLHVDYIGSGPCGPTQADKDVAINALPDANLPDDIRACTGTTVTITASLIGTAPFTVHWDDGLTQSGIATHSVSRYVVASGDVQYTIDSVTDASCTNSDMHKRIRVIGVSLPAIDSQTTHLVIPNGHTATLNVVTSAAGVTYQWYEGHPGDTSTPVGTNSPAYTTPALTHTTFYWVRLTNACGSVDSGMILVTVTGGGKGRAVRH